MLTSTLIPAPPVHWDEPTGCSPRGWWYPGTTSPRGWYLDYGPDTYRSPHLYCSPGQECVECQPGTVYAGRYPEGPRSDTKEHRWFTTVEAARTWVETGVVPA